MNHLVAPSILTADFSCLKNVIDKINNSEADWVHIDVMDGVFVPNISFGFHLIKNIKKLASKPLDVHLMIVEPHKFLNEFHEAGACVLTVHYEACKHLHRTVQVIKNLGMKPGVSLNPHTPVDLLEEILPELELVLIMTVNPGYGGQKFIESSYEKISKLVKLRKKTGSKALIEVDGGVNLSNAKKLVEAGVDVLVAGNTVFSSDNPSETIHALKNL
ncbi:MAG: ribulose-phosphate 3-epimerase [Bacteroidetes bacterium]|nr:ribulose-phosphate 3-epimerase [Bacteroidota bacterium]